MNRDQLVEFERLASASCDGNLSPSDQLRLDQLLVEHDEARQIWLDYSRMHVELWLHARAGVVATRVSRHFGPARQSRQLGASCDASAQPEASIAQDPPAEIPSSRPPRESVKRWAGLLVAGVAASALFVIAVSDRGSRVAVRRSDATPEQTLGAMTAIRRPQIVALMSTEGSDDSQDHPVALKRPLFVGEEVALASGRARIAMTGGAKLLIEAPFRLELVSPDHVRLYEGSLSAQLSEWANKGFVVDTNAMRVIDLGTTFAVTAESATVAEAQVLEGLIKVQPRFVANRDLKSFLLNEGESVRVDGESATRNLANLEAVIAQRRVQELSQHDSYQSIPLHNTGIGLGEGEEDPFWQVVAAGQVQDLSVPRYAVVCKPHQRYSINEPNKSQWIAINQANDPVPADTIYTFRTSFRLTGMELQSVQLIGQILADNGVEEIRLNGIPVDTERWIDNTHLQKFRRDEFHVVEVNSGFREGVNTIEIDVWNGGEYRKEGQHARLTKVPNPMALRVEWQAFGRPLKGRPAKDRENARSQQLN
jgi:hypothetical protein